MKRRLQLSRAKHPSLRGHARLAQRLAKLAPFYEYDEAHFFSSDEAPADVTRQRRSGFARLSERLSDRAPETIRRSEALEPGLSDLQFVNAYRVPFQFSRYVRTHLKVGSLLQESSGVLVRDLDGHSSFDLTGSYGPTSSATTSTRSASMPASSASGISDPFSAAYHPVVVENVRRLKRISGLDEVSFHMSGTEAVMQAVRLARYHTGRSHLVRFCGAYHGWWDDVQPGVGNPRTVRGTYTLKEMDEDTLRVLRTRNDIACVLVNPLQALHPNAAAPGDATLVNSDRQANFDRARLHRLAAAAA